jgi:ABC-type lipoprotein export system ATPase subunit
MTELLHATNLFLTRGGASVFRDLEMSIREGQHTLLLGRSGCGKTSLLYVIAQLLDADSGVIRFRGAEVSSLGSPRGFRLQNIGFIFQDVHLIEPLSVRHNIEIVRSLSGATHAPSPEELLRPLGLADKLGTRVSRLSRGERQRVAIARAFANAPALILADEPTASLDAENRDRSFDQMFELADRFSATVVVATHDTALSDRSDFVQSLRLHRGQLLGV